MSRFTPISRDALAVRLADLFDSRHPGTHPLRVGLDAPRFAGLAELVPVITARLAAVGRPAASVAATAFYRNASLRLEHGRTDIESFYHDWLDAAALEREVLVPLGAPNGRFLPTLRDPVTNRATRDRPQSLPANGVVVVSGELLLGAGLSFDLVVTAVMSAQARRRRSEPDWAWTLPAFDRYDADVDPAALADVVVRWDDPHRPAILVR